MSNSFEFDGFHEIPVEDTDGNPNSIDNQVDSYLDDLEGLSKFTKEGEGLKRNTALAATLHLGAEYTLPVYDRLKFGGLWTTRFQDVTPGLKRAYLQTYHLLPGLKLL